VGTQGRSMPPGADKGLLIDYSVPKKPAFDMMRHLRDPIVAIRKNDATTLLGWSYLEVGGRQVGTPSFFLLSNPRPLGTL